MRYVLICGLTSGVALATCLVAGRQLVALLDRVTLILVDRRQGERLIYDGGVLEVAGTRLDLNAPSFARIAEISLRPDGRVVLESGGQRFSMGTGQSVPHVVGSKFEITKDAGDEVVFTVEQSRLAWLTPFEMNFMTGSAPWRKRNVYLRLRWSKVSGAKLDVLWKTEQAYYRQDGWSPPRIEAITDGLIRVEIQDPGTLKVQSAGV